jgi:hypothetical protein
VNRDSGTNSANGGWLRRLVERSRCAAEGIRWVAALGLFLYKASHDTGIDFARIIGCNRNRNQIQSAYLLEGFKGISLVFTLADTASFNRRMQITWSEAE